MIDFTPETVRLATAAGYVLTFVGILAAVGRVPPETRRYCYPLALIVGFAAPAVVLQELGVGQVPVGAGTIDVVGIVRNLLNYPVLYGGIALLGGASRRLAGAVSAVSLTPMMTVNFAPAVGAGALGALVLVGIFAPYPVLLYLYFRPVWAAAQEASPRRRLLHWKARNIVLFLYAVILLYVLLVLGGLMPGGALGTFLFEYPVFVFQAVLPAYLVYKLVRLAEEESIRVGPHDRESTADTAAVDGAD